MSIGYRILIYVLIVTAIIGGLFRWGYVDGTAAQKIRGDKVIATQKAAYDKTVAEATAAKAAAELHALTVEQMTTKQLAEQAAGYEKEIENEKAAATARAAQYRNGERRMRIAIRSASAACSGAVPGAPGPGPVADGSATADIQPEVAGNLIGLADEADATVRKLSALQDYVATVLSRFGSASSIPEK